MPDPTDPPATAGAFPPAPAVTPEDRARAERLIYRIRCGLTGNAEDAGTIERLIEDRDRLAGELDTAMNGKENDLFRLYLRRMQEKLGVQPLNGLTWHETDCQHCGKRIMWCNGNTHDLTVRDVDAATCWACGRVNDLRDEMTKEIEGGEPQYEAKSSQTPKELTAERDTLQARVAALEADNARLMEELDGTECSHEDEEAAHLETLGMVGVANARLAALADVARQIQARGATMTEWRGGVVARVEYTVTADQLAVLLADARTPGVGACQPFVWGRTPPTVEGHYWIKDAEGDAFITTVHFNKYIDAFVLGGRRVDRVDPAVEWAGPIPEPAQPTRATSGVPLNSSAVASGGVAPATGEEF